jgi:hypothetical protein
MRTSAGATIIDRAQVQGADVRETMMAPVKGMRQSARGEASRGFERAAQSRAMVSGRQARLPAAEAPLAVRTDARVRVPPDTLAACLGVSA